jgi:cell division protein FtsB
MGYPKVSKKFSKRIKNPKVKSRLKMFVWTLGFVLLFFYFFWGDFGIFRIWILKYKVEALESDIISLKIQKQDMLWEIEKLKNDPEYLKKYAAKAFGYARPDQTVIQFIKGEPGKVNASESSEP